MGTIVQWPQWAATTVRVFVSSRAWASRDYLVRGPPFEALLPIRDLRRPGTLPVLYLTRPSYLASAVRPLVTTTDPGSIGLHSRITCSIYYKYKYTGHPAFAPNPIVSVFSNPSSSSFIQRGLHLFSLTDTKGRRVPCLQLG